jgi:hypothetical protein
MNTRQKIALAALLSEPVVTHMVACEPVLRDILLDAAQVIPEESRWREYSRLKIQATEYVGWYAHCDELCTSRYYLVIIEAIDTLLLRDGEQAGNLLLEEVA